MFFPSKNHEKIVNDVLLVRLARRGSTVS